MGSNYPDNWAYSGDAWDVVGLGAERRRHEYVRSYIGNGWSQDRAATQASQQTAKTAVSDVTGSVRRPGRRPLTR